MKFSEVLILIGWLLLVCTGWAAFVVLLIVPDFNPMHTRCMVILVTCFASLICLGLLDLLTIVFFEIEQRDKNA